LCLVFGFLIFDVFRGGCALVWLARDRNKNCVVAVKQFARNSTTKSKSDIESCRVELQVGKMLFHMDGTPKVFEKLFTGIKYIAALKGFLSHTYDHWLLNEVGGSSLNKLLFHVKGEFYRGERLYFIRHLPFYERIVQNPSILKKLMRKLLKGIIVFSHKKIIHCDLKPDNILLEVDEDRIESVKIIDFGSAFFYEEASNLRLSTPEYLSPECLYYLDNQHLFNNTETYHQNSIELCKRIHPWSVDIWSLGCIMLEILTGFPLWISYKCRTINGKKNIISTGLFGVSGRVGSKIMAKQQEVVKNLRHTLIKYNSFLHSKELIDLLKKMLDLDPLERISPVAALDHPFLKKKKDSS
jgi:dual specificity tyrosine-phosphorylation-regulated kinase 2/3/4